MKQQRSLCAAIGRRCRSRPGPILIGLGCALVLLAGLGADGCGSRGADTAGNNVTVNFRGLTGVAVNPTIPDQPRPFVMGIALTAAATKEAAEAGLEEAVQRNSTVAECIVLRPLIDWEAFRPGGKAEPERLDEVVLTIQLARAHGMKYSVVELDPLLDRHHVSPLPESLAGQDFSSPNVRAALRGMALAMARQARPTYISFAVEVNGYYDSNPADFANFVSLHKELYDEVKAVSPETKVAVAFNYESFLGLLKGVDEYSTDQVRWGLIEMFEPKIDAVAFSTLPWPVVSGPVGLPDDYISQIQKHTSRPILLTEVGWTTSPEVFSNEAKQAEYVAVMARQALRTPQLELMAWSIPIDPQPGSVFDMYPTFQHLGLFTRDGKAKAALALWKELLGKPYKPRSQ